MSQRKEAHHKATEWFDKLYKEHEENHENIPWARKDVNPLLQSYLDDATQTHEGKALVIGCGLGDDAKALANAGYSVVAIDISQTALALATERFKGSNILFEKQDIFDMPQKYKEHFDFVFEAFTIQSLPVEFREKMVKAITQTLSPKGKLLLVAHKREEQFKGPPWPLERSHIEMFQCHDLKELTHEIHEEPSKISNSRFRILYQKGC